MFIFPMAGLSSWFKKAGFTKPKFILQAGSKSLFEHALSGFTDVFDEERFLFIYLAGSVDKSFIVEKTQKLGIPKHNIETIALKQATDGQATTVAHGLLQARVNMHEPITIFNIDTIYSSYKLPDTLQYDLVDGYIDVFSGSGDHWSFVKPCDANQQFGRALEVTEKNRISDLCSTGLYYFRKAGLFLDAFKAVEHMSAAQLQGGEKYIAPLYNSLISQQANIFYHKIATVDINFAGTPAEYDNFCKKYNWTPERPDINLTTCI